MPNLIPNDSERYTVFAHPEKGIVMHPIVAWLMQEGEHTKCIPLSLNTVEGCITDETSAPNYIGIYDPFVNGDDVEEDENGEVPAPDMSAFERAADELRPVLAARRAAIAKEVEATGQE